MWGFDEMTCLNAFSNASGRSSTSTSRAISLNRLDCSGSSGLSLSVIAYSLFSKNAKFNCPFITRLRNRQRATDPFSFLMHTNRLISQALSFGTQQRQIGPFLIVHAQLCAVGHTEIKLSQIPLQVLFAHLLVNPNQTALENAEIALGGVGMHPAIVAIARKLFLVFNGFVLANRHQEFVRLRAIGMQNGSGFHALLNGLPHLAHAALINHFGTDRAAALYKGDETLVVRPHNPVVGAGLAGRDDLSLIGLDNDAGTANRVSGTGVHRLTDAVTKEPRGFQTATKSALQLTSADAFLAAAHEVHGLQPNPKRHVAGLKNGAHADGIRLFAGIALVQARTGGFAVQLANALSAFAVKAYRAMRPEFGFHIRESGFFIVEMLGGKCGLHGGNSLTAITTY
jgi:hypothetical protein